MTAQQYRLVCQCTWVCCFSHNLTQCLTLDTKYLFQTISLFQVLRNGSEFGCGHDEQQGKMVGKLWNMTKVTVKENSSLTELDNLCKVSHPGILLLMAVCHHQDDDERQQLQLVFQHVALGSLYHWIHVKVNKIFSLVSTFYCKIFLWIKYFLQKLW